ALDPRQLRFALLQRAEGVIAFLRQRLEIVAKLLRRCGLARHFGRLGVGHSERTRDALTSEPAFAIASRSDAVKHFRASTWNPVPAAMCPCPLRRHFQRQPRAKRNAVTAHRTRRSPRAHRT